jgi:hypothetical protein
VITAQSLRRGDELRVDGNEWIVARVHSDEKEVEVLVARRSCGVPGTYRLRFPIECVFSIVESEGRRLVSITPPHRTVPPLPTIGASGFRQRREISGHAVSRTLDWP